jgi:hypothetical protein
MQVGRIQELCTAISSETDLRSLSPPSKNCAHCWPSSKPRLKPNLPSSPKLKVSNSSKKTIRGPNGRNSDVGHFLLSPIRGLTFDTKSANIFVSSGLQPCSQVDVLLAFHPHLFIFHSRKLRSVPFGTLRTGATMRPKVAVKKRSEFDPKTFLSTIDGGGRKVVMFSKKQTIFVQGDPSDSVFYIQKGKVRLTVVSKSGKEATISVLNESDFFGEGCLTGQLLRLCSATAMTDCSVVRIEKSP